MLLVDWLIDIKLPMEKKKFKSFNSSQKEKGRGLTFFKNAPIKISFKSINRKFKLHANKKKGKLFF